MIDLHVHTTASDGSLTPWQVVELARQRNVTSLAITDHDTVAGVEEARTAGAENGVEIVPGIEFSVEFSPGVLHLLGYQIDIHDPPLTRKLLSQVAARDARNPRIARALQSLGMEVTMEEVRASAGGDVIGRPHFGKVLLEKGYVTSIDEAFERYLERGRPAYVEQERISSADAIKLIAGAGGVSVLAHPYQLKLDSPESLDRKVRELVDQGLQGIEVYYSRHTAEMRQHYATLARRYHLIETGGSDFHGSTKPHIQLGTGQGDLQVPAEVLPALRRRREEQAAKR